MERIEVTVYPNGAETVESILKEFEVPYLKLEGKSDNIELFRYTITAPDDIAHDVIDKLAKAIDPKQKSTFITNEKLEATVSDYLEKLAEKIRKPKK